MNTGERIKKIRMDSGLTLEKFGARLGIGKTAVSKIERGENKLTVQNATMISKEFGVSVQWLMTGEGEMKLVTSSGAAAEIADRLGLGPWATQALERFMALNEKEQVLFLEILEKILAPAADQELSIDEKVASYRAELEAQANFEKSSALPTGDAKEA